MPIDLLSRKKYVKRNTWEYRNKDPERANVIFLHIWKKNTYVLLWQDCWAAIVYCAINDGNAHCHYVSVYILTLSLVLPLKGESPKQFFHCLWKFLFHFAIRESAKYRGFHVCTLTWVYAIMGHFFSRALKIFSDELKIFFCGSLFCSSKLNLFSWESKLFSCVLHFFFLGQSFFSWVQNFSPWVYFFSS